METKINQNIKSMKFNILVGVSFEVRGDEFVDGHLKTQTKQKTQNQRCDHRAGTIRYYLGHV